MKKTKIIGPLFLLTLVGSGAYADEIFHSYRQGRADFGISVDYFKTTANFGSDGSKNELLSGNYLQNIDINIGARYVLFDDWALYANTKIGSSESTDAISTRKNSSVSQVLLGTDYQLFNTGFWSSTVDFSYTQAVEKVSPTTDNVLNNDGANEVKGLITTGLDFDGLVPFVQVGMKYRTEGLSSLLLYGGGAELRLNLVTLGGMVRGFTTLKADENTDRPFVRDVITNQVDAGSRKYDSINPALLNAELYFKYIFDRDLSFKTFGAYTVMGTNTAVNFQVGAALNWGFGSDANRPKSTSSKRSAVRKPMPKNTLSVDPTEKGFKEDTNDGVNQDYFKPLAPAKDQYIEQLEGSPKSLKNATEPETEPAAVAPAQKKPEPFAKEYKIKLRMKKKKKKKKDDEN